MTDSIRKQVVLRAPRARVWRAISDSQAFGTWFGMTVEGPFVAGKTVKGKMAKTQVDARVAEQQEPYVGMAFDLLIEAIEEETRFAFRWHPGADPNIEPGAPMTLVTFELADAPGGTELTITESGFDALPLEKRARAFADNEGGWQAQLTLIAKYLDVA